MTLTRRSFITKAAVASGAASVFRFDILKAKTVGANESVGVAFIGVGGRGARHLTSVKDDPLVKMVAFADVDDAKAESSYKMCPSVPRFRDFRKMLDKHDKEIDAVVISTPDHTHHFPARWCLLAGKHVYVEKPLAHSVDECRDLASLEKQTGLACQMGNQGHSGQGIELLEKWIEAGILGDIESLVAWNATGKRPNAKVRPAAQPIPDTLDWDLWLGPSPEIPYNSAYCPPSWRWWFQFGHGSLGDWACHNMDAPYTALNLALPSSIKIRSTGPSRYNFPEHAEIDYRFPRKGNSDISFKWYSGSEFGPERPKDLESSRQLGSNGGGTLIYGPKANVMMNSHASSPRIFPESHFRELAPTLPKASKRSNHMKNWILACKGEEKTRSNFEYAAKITEVIHYGNIALHVNRDLKVDPAKGKILSDREATKLMSSPKPRKGWKI